ncbi:hypothetical protein EIN_467720 [Entamoeba invadens IP1]|uniref:Exportin-1/Importin-beta-like domain-containing protein n=1 Tax=Entamoeba invadens IP1 TaxID=370355 RepID=A0A0A1TWG0_ENTIV|nr:hypothetical protein EIN_467720 [Entamoeba invadens IP1]ELP83668.1 hypothetical protein EIN_467720 [Entamoeba invadens IP1]|eukprot:XP_004183014.1 hypothetical protein EIN_467720 [Entamoeba invadens IP1]
MDQTIRELFSGQNVQENQKKVMAFTSTQEGFLWAMKNTTNPEKVYSWFSLSVLTFWICHHPQNIPLVQLQSLLLDSLQFHIKSNNKEASNKLAVLFCAVTRWTFNGQTLCGEIANFAKNEETVQMALLLFSTFAEEYRNVDKKYHVPSQRIQWIKSTFQTESADIVKLLVIITQRGKVEALSAMSKYIGWVDTKALIEAGVFATLTQTVLVQQMVKPSLECLVEYLQSNKTPLDPHFHISIVSLTLKLLTIPDIPPQQILYLLIRTFEICVPRIPFDDTFLQIPRSLNAFLQTHKNDFTVVSTCFDVWAAFFDLPICGSLCISDEFGPIAEDTCRIILPLLFSASYSGITLLDTSKVGDEQSEFEIFIFNAYQVLMSLVDFQGHVVLPLIIEITNQTFLRLNEKRGVFTDGDICDISTASKLFLETSSNLLVHVDNLETLQKMYTPLITLLCALPNVHNEDAKIAATNLKSAIQTMYGTLHELCSTPTLLFVEQLLTLFIQTVTQCKEDKVCEQVVDLYFELVLACRPEVFNLNIVNEMMKDSVTFVRRFCSPARKYVAIGVSEIYVFPNTNSNFTKKDLEERFGVFQNFVSEIVVKPIIEMCQTNQFGEYPDVCKILKGIVKGKETLNGVNKQLIVGTLGRLISEIFPQALRVMDAHNIRVTLVTIREIIQYMSSALDERGIVEVLTIMMESFKGKIRSFVESGEKEINKTMCLVILIGEIYVKEWSHKTKGKSEVYTQTVMRLMNFVVDEVLTTLDDKSIGNELYRDSVSLFFNISEAVFNEVGNKVEFYVMVVQLVIKLIGMSDIELAKEVIEKIQLLGTTKKFFVQPIFKEMKVQFVVELLGIAVVTPHSIDDIVGLLYYVMDSDVPSLLVSFYNVLDLFFNKYPNISVENKNEVKSLFVNAQDMPTFTFAMSQFVNDMHCYLP